MANEEQKSQWNAAMGTRWVQMQTEYDRLFEEHGRLVIDALGLLAGEAVLDVGCGCGATALAAARRVGGAGTVLGLDLSLPMLDHARKRARDEKLANVRFEQADVETAPLARGAQDAVVSRFGVMFFDDPVAAFANLYAASRPGGRLAFACWQSAAKNPWFTVPAAAAGRVLAVPSMDSDAPGPFAFQDGARVRSILEAAGFARIEMTEAHLPLEFGATPEAAAPLIVQAGAVARALASADEATKATVLAVVRDDLARRFTASGVVLDSTIWVVTAARAE